MGNNHASAARGYAVLRGYVHKVLRTWVLNAGLIYGRNSNISSLARVAEMV